MSAIPPKADMVHQSSDVRFVPKADILRCGKERRYLITSSAVAERRRQRRLCGFEADDELKRRWRTGRS
jgi:hypothetical protein